MNISDAVRKVCLSFPEAEEAESHSMMNFKVRGKTFATYAINHHGDGRVALWLEAPKGSQQLHTETEPRNYFVPQYVGPKGWLGVELNKGLSWASIAQRVREAYEEVAPAALSEDMGDTIALKGRIRDLKPTEINPLLEPKTKGKVARVETFCESLPESARASAFGNPVWKAGKKTFVCIHRYEKRLALQTWVGLEQQSFMIADRRFSIPKYMGHNGWIDLDIEEEFNPAEVESLILTSYRHFALQRMLKQLDGAA